MWQNKGSSISPFDRSIVLTAAVTCVMGLFVMGYRIITYNDCSGAGFMVKEEQLVAGQIASFRDQSAQADGWVWDFGDDSPPAAGKEAIHIFNHPGDYWVTLRTSGGCVSRKKVTVRKREPPDSSSRYPDFSLPATARVGETIRFTDHTEGAKEWKWSFGETMQVDATTKDPTYVFNSSGVKTVTLIVNGRERYAAKKSITVFARPVEKPKFDLDPPERVKLKQNEPDAAITISEMPLAPPLTPKREMKAPEINRVQLEDYLLQVAEEDREAESLKSFFCDGYDSRVRANGEEKNLQALLMNIQGKRISIRNLEVVKHKESRCIDFIKVDYKRKKVLGIF